MHFEHLHDQKQQMDQIQANGNGHAEAELVSEVEQPALLQEPEQMTAQVRASERHFDICPSCGEALLAREEGCAKCYGCGHAEC